MTDTNHDSDPTGDSRRSFMKKGALATGALALGTSATNTASASSAVQDGEALVFSYDYFPGADADVIARLEQGTTVSVLQTAEEETVPEISQPDEWNGHVIRYDMPGETAGVTTFLFSETSLSAGDTATLGEDASMFSPQLNLLSTSLETDGAAEDTEDTEDNETDTEDNETETDTEELEDPDDGNETDS